MEQNRVKASSRFLKFKYNPTLKMNFIFQNNLWWETNEYRRIVMGCQSNKLTNYIGRGFKGQKKFAKK
jgi:hypothetical protein